MVQSAPSEALAQPSQLPSKTSTNKAVSKSSQTESVEKISPQASKEKVSPQVMKEKEPNVTERQEGEVVQPTPIIEKHS